MCKKILILIFLSLFITRVTYSQGAPKPAQPLTVEEADEEKWFWPLIGTAGALFITGVVLFAFGDEYDDRANAFSNNPEYDELATKSALCWTFACISLGGATGTTLLALKIKYEPEAIMSGLDRKPALGLAYHYRF